MQHFHATLPSQKPTLSRMGSTRWTYHNELSVGIPRGHPKIHFVKNSGLFLLGGGGGGRGVERVVAFSVKMTSWIRKNIAIKVD